MVPSNTCMSTVLISLELDVVQAGSGAVHDTKGSIEAILLK